MKGIFFVVTCLLFASQGFTQETRFGLTAGYLNFNLTSSHQGSEISENASGFFTGILGDFTLSEGFHIEPAAIYGRAEEVNILFIPILLKYNISQSGFNVFAGPQGTMFLDELKPGIKRLGWDLSFGAEYNINEDLFLRARYALELTNRYSKDFTDSFDGTKLGINTLFAGIGFKF